MTEDEQIAANNHIIVVNEPQPSVLVEAEGIINGQRRADYGTPGQSFSRVAGLWSEYLSNRPGPPRPLSPEDVALMMVLFKVARATQGYHRDSLVDIAGYAGCIELVQREREGTL